MPIDRSNFVLIAGTLAAGGVGGWALRDRSPNAAPAPAAAPAPKASAAPAAPVPVDIVATAGGLVCDDAVGVPEECPSVGPSDEGVCANVIFKRCGDFKAALKPKVAQQAVSCLRQLKGNERCDPVRINQCGHAALMSACPDPAPPAKGNYEGSSPTRPATVTISHEQAPPASPLGKLCESLVKSCAGQPLAPTLNDCHQTLAGMNESGRANTAECVVAHCGDRGLLGCEAMPKAVTPPTPTP